MRSANALTVRSGLGARDAITVHDPAFLDVLGDAPALVPVVGTDAHEGPVYVAAEDALSFTTLPRQGDEPAPGFPQVAIKRLALAGLRFPLERERVTVVCADANPANGMALGPDGRLVVCDQGTRTEHDPRRPADRRRRDRGRRLGRAAAGPAGRRRGLFITTDTAVWAAVLDPTLQGG